MSRDLTDGARGLAEVSSQGTPARAAWVVVGLMAAIIVISVVAFDADINDTFGWSGTIGTLILLVAYVLTTIGAIRLVFVQHKIQVPQWEIVIPLAALVAARLHALPQRVPLPGLGTGPLVPGRCRWLDPAVGDRRARRARHGRAGSASGWPPTRGSAPSRAIGRRASPMPDSGLLADLPLIDHHCHGVARDPLDRAGLRGAAVRGRRSRPVARLPVRLAGGVRRTTGVLAVARPAGPRARRRLPGPARRARRRRGQPAADQVDRDHPSSWSTPATSATRSRAPPSSVSWQPPPRSGSCGSRPSPSR